MSERDEVAGVIYAELASIVRRIRAQAGQVHPGLSLTGYTLLLHLDEAGPSRAGDLVDVYQLNKSTVSRQLGELAHAGLVERTLDVVDSRVHIVAITGTGHDLVARIQANLRHQMKTRLDGWPPQDTETFTRLLQRYNNQPATQAGAA